MTLSDGSSTTLRLFAKASAIGLMRPTEAGELVFQQLTRIRTHRAKDKNCPTASTKTTGSAE